MAPNAKTLYLFNGTPIEITKVDNEGNYDAKVYCCSVDTDQSKCSAKVYDPQDGELLDLNSSCSGSGLMTDWESDIDQVLGGGSLQMRNCNFIVATPVFSSTIEFTDL